MTNYEVGWLDRDLRSFSNLNRDQGEFLFPSTVAWARGLAKCSVPHGPEDFAPTALDVHGHYNPSRCAHFADVEAAAEKWEEQLRDYKRCGGREMPEHEKA